MCWVRNYSIAQNTLSCIGKFPTNAIWLWSQTLIHSQLTSALFDMWFTVTGSYITCMSVGVWSLLSPPWQHNHCVVLFLCACCTAQDMPCTSSSWSVRHLVVPPFCSSGRARPLLFHLFLWNICQPFRWSSVQHHSHTGTVTCREQCMPMEWQFFFFITFTSPTPSSAATEEDLWQ